MATYTNKKSGESIESPFTHAEAAEILASHQPDSWVWFWLHKCCQDAQDAQKMASQMSGLLSLFTTAKENGLSNPRIFFVFLDSKWRLYLSKAGNVCIKSAERLGSGSWGEQMYEGCILADSGKSLPPRGDVFSDDAQTVLRQLESDAVGFLAECSKAANMCSYCGRELTDDVSKKLGYGGTCAKYRNLPWGKKAAAEVKTIDPVMASASMQSAAAQLDATFNLTEEISWLAGCDRLEELGKSSLADRIRRIIWSGNLDKYNPLTVTKSDEINW